MYNITIATHKMRATCILWQVLEDKISELPWLEEKKQLQRNEDEKDKRPEGKFGEPAFKPYVSGEQLLTYHFNKMIDWHHKVQKVLNCRKRVM